MTEPIPVLIPLVNPNEPEALLAALNVAEGQHVDAGTPLCILETTKSTAEVSAEVAGFITGLRFTQGAMVRAGERLCYLAPNAAWAPPMENSPAGRASANPDASPGGLPPGLRITQPALALALQSGLDLSNLPAGPLVTENLVRSRLEKITQPATLPDGSDFDPTAIIVYGGGGHGKMLIDLLKTGEVYRIIGVIDDRLKPGSRILDVPVLGSVEQLPKLAAEGVRLAVNAVGGIGDIRVRIQVFQKLAQAGFTCPSIVHRRACIETSARLAAGAQVLALAYVGSQAQVGLGAIIGTGAIVSHDCQLGSYVNVSPGALLAGGVILEESALVGMGATVNLQVKVGAGARIGNGATVKADVPPGAIVRAGSVWPD
jgi:acetyltransferase EpsM